MRTLSICLSTLCLYRAQMLQSHATIIQSCLKQPRAEFALSCSSPTFLMPILHFLALSLFSCPSLLPFNATAGNRRSNKQCELAVLPWENAIGDCAAHTCDAAVLTDGTKSSAPGGRDSAVLLWLNASTVLAAERSLNRDALVVHCLFPYGLW